MLTLLRHGRAGHDSFRRQCVAVLPGFLSPPDCQSLLCSVTAWRAKNPTALIHRPTAGRDLRYHVIDGLDFDNAVVGAAALVEAVRAEAEAQWQGPLSLIDVRQAACNVNITPPGGSYRWHFDRNRVTALLYLNEVGGGQTELYPHQRVALGPLGQRQPSLQAALDRLAATPAARGLRRRRLAIAPAAGTLVLLRGDRTLHSVRPVTGSFDRINIVLAFDTPGTYHAAPRLDDYLYQPHRTS